MTQLVFSTDRPVLISGVRRNARMLITVHSVSEWTAKILRDTVPDQIPCIRVSRTAFIAMMKRFKLDFRVRFDGSKTPQPRKKRDYAKKRGRQREMTRVVYEEIFQSTDPWKIIARRYQMYGVTLKVVQQIKNGVYDAPTETA